MTSFKYGDYKKLVKDVRIANKRIQRIQARYGENSWAINELYDKIDSASLKAVSGLTGNIRIDKGMSDVQLKAIAKATEKFLSSKTSKLSGIKSTIKETKKSLQATFGDRANQVSDADVDKLYSLVSDKRYRDTTEKISASTVWANLIKAKEKNLSENEFVELFENKANIKDIDIQTYLDEVYNKYMV